MKNLKITNLSSLKNLLDTLPLDIEEDIYCLYQEDFLLFLNTPLQGNLEDSELENIADLLESKDGVSFENENIKESIHKIANIDIQGVSMFHLVRSIIKECK